MVWFRSLDYEILKGLSLFIYLFLNFFIIFYQIKIEFIEGVVSVRFGGLDSVFQVVISDCIWVCYFGKVVGLVWAFGIVTWCGIE